MLYASGRVSGDVSLDQELDGHGIIREYKWDCITHGLSKLLGFFALSKAKLDMYACWSHNQGAFVKLLGLDTIPILHLGRDELGI